MESPSFFYANVGLIWATCYLNNRLLHCIKIRLNYLLHTSEWFTVIITFHSSKNWHQTRMSPNIKQLCRFKLHFAESNQKRIAVLDNLEEIWWTIWNFSAMPLVLKNQTWKPRLILNRTKKADIVQHYSMHDSIPAW